MAEWRVEAGIGETRAALIDGDTILAARLCWHEPLRTGAVVAARLDHRQPGTAHGAARLDDGGVLLIDQIPPALTHGAPILVRITRPALAETGRFKLPRGRLADAPAPQPAPALADTLATTGYPVRLVGPLDRQLDHAGWADLVETAASGTHPFPGGSLTITATPAMTLIDVDGAPPLAPLALRAAQAVADALARLDLTGSIGIDFPGLANRTERQAVDSALESALAARGWHGDRTAMNGFGFVQLISRLERPSLIARWTFDAPRAAAMVLLRAAERIAEPGVLTLHAHPAVLARITPAHEVELARRSGRTVQRRPDDRLAIHAGFAQAIVP